MNCNPCCGCCPPITTYNPSVADNFPTILQQVEYLKALLKKYPSQQWFITQEKVTEETVKLDSTKIPLRGRGIQVGDFILGNTVDGTILIFQYDGVMIENIYYAVQYVGIYSSQILAEQAEANAQEALQRGNSANELAGQALSLAQTNENNISVLETTINNVALLKHDNDFTTQGNEFNFFNVNDGQTSGWLNYRTVGGGNIINNISFGNGDGNGTLVNISCANPLQYNHAATKGYVDSNIKNQDFKTFFGNQLIQGTGNIDLYKHHIKLEFTTADSNAVYFDFISSRNTVCDSLEDLKTVLGNEFTIPAYGTVFGVFDETSTLFIAQYLLINSSEAFLQTYYSGMPDFNAKSILLALNPFTLSDNVTTI